MAFVREALKKNYPKRVLEAESFPQARDLIGGNDISLLIAEIIDVVQNNYRLIDLVRDARASRRNHFPVVVYTNESVKPTFMEAADEIKPDVMLSKLHTISKLYTYIDTLLRNPTAYKDTPVVVYVDTNKDRRQFLSPYITKRVL
ncbi:MAG TPA: hypothetical protein VJJ52_02725 [Candidatus Nanoarchaeia archaeon]|nr:hypothetical protein [Candidatus Nanoarchaeia archaeon]